MLDKFFLWDTHTEARNRLQLIYRTTRVSEPSAAHLRNRYAQTCEDRCHDKCRLIPDPSGTMLIDLHTVDGCKTELVAALCHRMCQCTGLVVCHALIIDTHQPRTHLIIRDFSLRKPFHDKTDFICGMLCTAPLLHDHIVHSIHPTSPLS